jgi:hypothetical protein
LWPAFKYSMAPPQPLVGSRTAPVLIPSQIRRNDFIEVSQCFSDWGAKAEALRCLRCDIKTVEHA